MGWKCRWSWDGDESWDRIEDEKNQLSHFIKESNFLKFKKIIKIYCYISHSQLFCSDLE